MVPFPSGAASVIRRGDTAVSVLGVSGVRDSVGRHVQAPGRQEHTLVDLRCVCVSWALREALPPHCGESDPL